MPELPEVETVRRGLAPVMEGACFAKVEVRRRDLRWSLPRGFAQRLHGECVEGIGRRAKYLLADLSSGDVLLMHLGMSGSFRVNKNGAPGKYYHERSGNAARAVLLAAIAALVLVLMLLVAANFGAGTGESFADPSLWID